MNIGKFKLVLFDEIDSTNSEAIRIAKNGKIDSNYAIFAKSQTKGRGRSGKNWQSTFGNLHVSFLIKPNKKLELLPQLSFITALVVYDTIKSFKPNDIKLKWPNDILVNGKKIAGILLESIKVANNYYLIIGIGINIIYHPTNIDQPTTSLVNENLPYIEPRMLLEILVKNFEKYYQIWDNESFSFV